MPTAPTPPWPRYPLAFLAVVVLALSIAAPAAARPTAAPSVRSGFPLHAEFTPNDQYYPLQWGLTMVGAPSAWDVTLGNHNVVVAVVDTGVYYTDNDIAGNMWSNTYPGCPSGTHGYDFIAINCNPMDQDSPTYHGTGVAGVVGAVIDNSAEIAGVADVSVMALRALGSNGEGSSYNTSLAIRWAVDHGARVINLSLGTNNTFAGPTDISLAIDYAFGKGALVVAAAGNSGAGSLDYPAALPNVVSVAAVDPNGNLASYSNYGPGLSISAPGGSPGATSEILTLDPDPSHPTGVHYLQGTSLATPFVSGVAGLLLSADPTLTNVELWNVLNSSATPKGSRYNTQYGWGIVNAWDAINALNQPFVSVNSYPTSVSRSASFGVGWSVLGPAGLTVTDTHVVWGTDPARLGNATPAQNGTTRMSYSASGLAIPGSADTVYFRVLAVVNGQTYTSPVLHVAASSLPDFLFVLINILSSNLLYLFLFIIALAAVVAFVPQRRARSRQARYRAMYAAPRYQAPSPPPGPPPTATAPTMQARSAAPPAPVEFVRPAAPPAAPAAQAVPPPTVAAKKRCPNCGTLVNAENLFCFYCGSPFR